MPKYFYGIHNRPKVGERVKIRMASATYKNFYLKPDLKARYIIVWYRYMESIILVREEFRYLMPKKPITMHSTLYAFKSKVRKENRKRYGYNKTVFITLSYKCILPCKRIKIDKAYISFRLQRGF